METEQFNEIVQERVDASLKGLVKKAAEYAGPSDRLHNFKVAAALGKKGETQSQALAGMMKKHTVSVYDMINSGKAHSEEMWDEKIGDHINYLLLLRATIVEDKLVKKDPSRLDEISFDRQEDAQKVLDELFRIIQDVGQVSVGNYKEASGINPVFGDHRRGWTSLEGVAVIFEISEDTTWYSINLPPIEILD